MQNRCHFARMIAEFPIYPGKTVAATDPLETPDAPMCFIVENTLFQIRITFLKQCAIPPLFRPWSPSKLPGRAAR